MLNRYPIWKNILIAAVILICGFYALPNLYGKDPSIQISSEKKAPVDVKLLQRVEKALTEKSIKPIGSEIANQKLLIRFDNQDDQRNALDIIKVQLGDDYISALNLASKTPGWIKSAGGNQMNLGLDLRGGVHFLMEVDMNQVVSRQEKDNAERLKTLFRENKIRYMPPITLRDGIDIRFKSADIRKRAYKLIRTEMEDMLIKEHQLNGSYNLKLYFSEEEQKNIEQRAIEQNISTLRNRVNELGVAEPIIQRQGANRIVVQLPGVQDTGRAKDILGTTATLALHLVDEKNNALDARQTGRIPPGSLLKFTVDKEPVLLQRRVIVTGKNIINATSGFDQESNSPAVFITMDGKGASLMTQWTRDNIGKQMAVLFIEDKIKTIKKDGKNIKQKKHSEEVINIAVIRDQLSKRFQISGLDSPQEARDLALLIRAGSLAAPMGIIEERTVGPSLGQDNINKGFISVVAGMILVLIFMAVYYRVFGLVADLALVVNIVLIMALLSMINATLTLPGIAGIVLTVGMAVDANVLIFERIREEIRVGNSVQAGIHSGYEKAFSTIADANITTLIAAIVLFAFGTGPVKGFAVTLSLGILTSMFTSILGTRAVINLIYGGKRVSKLSI